MKKKIAIIISCVFVGVLVLGTLGFGIYELTRSKKLTTAQALQAVEAVEDYYKSLTNDGAEGVAYVQPVADIGISQGESASDFSAAELEIVAYFAYLLNNDMVEIGKVVKNDSIDNDNGMMHISVDADEKLVYLNIEQLYEVGVVCTSIEIDYDFKNNKLNKVKTCQTMTGYDAETKQYTESDVLRFKYKSHNVKEDKVDALSITFSKDSTKTNRQIYEDILNKRIDADYIKANYSAINYVSTKVSTLKDTYSTTINGDQDGNILYDNLSVLQKIDVLNVFESIANEMVGYDNEVKQIINKNPIVNNDIVKVFE